MWKIKAQPNLTVYVSRGELICIQKGDPGDTSEGKFAVIGIRPNALAEVIERMQAAAERLRGPDVSGTEMHLPGDLEAALHETRPRKVKVEAADYMYGTDTIALKPLRRMQVEVLKVRPQFEPLTAEDPHRGERGYYAVPAVNLVQGDAAWSLLWLPTERRFGTFDREHTTLMAFCPGVTWAKLRADIQRYFAATNSGGDIEDPELAEYLAPWPAHPFVTED